MRHIYHVGLFLIIFISQTSCLLPQSEALTSRTRVYRRPVDVERRIKFHVNQVGYDVDGPKKAIVESVGRGTTFDLVDAATGEVVFTGNLQVIDNFTEWGGGPIFHVADFSAHKKPGIVKMKIKDYFSHAFSIQKNVLYFETFESLVDYFNRSRASYPAVWQTDGNLPFFDSERRADVRGGWYDASGDISKYLSHLSYANFMNPQQIPLAAWSLAFAHSIVSTTISGESLNQKLIEEALWGADYLVRILDNDGYFYLNVFDHWSGDMYQRKICAFETQSGTMTRDWQAAFREGGGMAIAALARITTLNVAGEFSSAQYLAAAQKGFDHLQHNNLKYCDDGRENIIDDYTALLAAVELYAATQDDTYLAAARTRAQKMKKRLHTEGYFIADDNRRPFWHASDAGLPLVALTLYAQMETEDELKAQIAVVIEKHLEYLLHETESVPNPFGYARQHFLYDGKVMSGFFIPHVNETGYWWQGENARLASLASAALMGRAFLKNAAHKQLLKSFAQDQLNWILGMNPFGLCFLKGAGSVNSEPYALLPNDKHHGDIDGGIANGITGSGATGEGIEFYGAPGLGARTDFRWRWLEQWLPHSSWFLIAVALSSAGDR